MVSDGWRWVKSLLSRVMVVAVLVLVVSRSTPLIPWQVYEYRDESFALLPSPSLRTSQLPSPLPPVSLSPCLPFVPPSWDVTAASLADVTGDGVPECVFLVWRPWRDWPIQRWSAAPSPIADFHDAAGDSCHLILLDPSDGREIWAGSALPVPLLALAVGDVDGDGWDEVVTLEGDYASGRLAPATHVDVWRWNGFGFTLAWRSSPGTFRQLCLTEAGNGGILHIAVR